MFQPNASRLWRLLLPALLLVGAGAFSGCKSCEESCAEQASMACGENGVASAACTTQQSVTTRYNLLTQQTELVYVTIETCSFTCNPGGGGGIGPDVIVATESASGMAAVGPRLQGLEAQTRIGQCATPWVPNFAAEEELSNLYGGEWLALSPPQGLPIPDGMEAQIEVRLTHVAALPPGNEKPALFTNINSAMRQSAQSEWDVQFEQAVIDYGNLIVAVEDPRMVASPWVVGANQDLVVERVRFKGTNANLPRLTFHAQIVQDGVVLSDQEILPAAKLRPWQEIAAQEVVVPTAQLAAGDYELRFVAMVGEIAIESRNLAITISE